MDNLEIVGLLYTTQMAPKYENIYVKNLRENIDKSKLVNSYIPQDILAKSEAIYFDLMSLGINDDQLYSDLFYLIIKPYALDRDDNKEINNRIMSKTFFNKEFREKVMSLDKWKSGFISFAKTIVPKLDKLLLLLEQKKSYAAMTSYKDLLNFINIEAMDPKWDEEKQTEELDKRYSIPYNTIDKYKTRMKKLEFKKDKIWDKLGYSKYYNYSAVCNMVQKYLHDLMVKYEKQTGCFFKQFNENVDLYYFGKLAIIAYKYDDNPGMNLRTNNGVYDWRSKEFWKIISDPTFDFSKANFTDHGFDADIRYHLKADMTGVKGDIISTPQKYLDEAFLKTMCGNEDMDIDLITMDLLRKMGFPCEETPTDKLITTNGSYYFKNPLKFEDLEIKDLSQFEVLQKLLQKEPNERMGYLKWLREHDKEEKHQLPSSINYNDTPQKEFTPRLPYKD